MTLPVLKYAGPFPRPPIRESRGPELEVFRQLFGGEQSLAQTQISVRNFITDYLSVSVITIRVVKVPHFQ